MVGKSKPSEQDQVESSYTDGKAGREPQGRQGDHPGTRWPPLLPRCSEADPTADTVIDSG